MNDKQKICLWIGIVFIVVMGLFPPWYRVVERPRDGTKIYSRYPAAYCCIFSPPNIRGGNFLGNTYKIDFARLAIQYFVVAVVTAGLIITLRDKKDPKQ